MNFRNSFMKVGPHIGIIRIIRESFIQDMNTGMMEGCF